MGVFGFPDPYCSSQEFMRILNEAMKQIHPYARENDPDKHDYVLEWINFKYNYDYIGKAVHHEIL